MDHAHEPAAVDDTQRRAARLRDALDRLAEFARRLLQRQARHAQHGIDGTFAHDTAPDVDARKARLRGERDERPARDVGLRLAEAAFGERDDGAALGRLVGHGGQQRRRGQLFARCSRHRQEVARETIAESDGARLVEEQRIDIASSLDGPARRRHDVEADQPVHPGDTDGREQTADRGGDKRNE